MSKTIPLGAVLTTRHSDRTLVYAAAASIVAVLALPFALGVGYSPQHPTGIDVDVVDTAYVLNHHGEYNWPRHTRIELGQ